MGRSARHILLVLELLVFSAQAPDLFLVLRILALVVLGYLHFEHQVLHLHLSDREGERLIRIEFPQYANSPQRQ